MFVDIKSISKDRLLHRASVCSSLILKWCLMLQRHEEPKFANEEYEQGTYVYFDYNIMHDDMQSGWCYRLKQDFTFKYDALEDELQV